MDGRIVIQDNRILNALCRRLMKAIDAQGEIYPHPQYHYIEFVNVDDLSPAIYEHIEYKGNYYKLTFYDGCFSPYFTRLLHKFN